MEKTRMFTLAGRVLKNLFRKPATTQYPFEPVDYPERMRGHIRIQIENCISCGLCMRSCPSQAIQVDRKAGTWTIDRFDCVQCGSCVNVCPKKCLYMEKGYTAPDVTKKSETFTRPVEEKKVSTASSSAQSAGAVSAGAASSGEASAGAAGGRPVMDPEKCVYCTLCAKKCPQEAIEVARKEKLWKLDEEKCVGCGLCAESCPKSAIEMKQ